jgi:hypothetical protein
MLFLARLVLCILLLAPAIVFSGDGPADPALYENKWLVIIGNYRSFDMAEDANNKGGYHASILLSTHFENLVPGWYVLVMKEFFSKKQAQEFSQELMDVQGIENYIKNCGQLFFSDEQRYRIVELDDEDYSSMGPYTFYHIGNESPDQKKTVSFESHEEDPEEFPVVRMIHDTNAFYELYVFANTEDIAWSSRSDKFAFVDYDALYLGGDQRLYILDVHTFAHVDFSLHELIEGEDFENRSMLTLYNLEWLASGDGVIFSMDVDFLGTSGDDMVDRHRIEKLGENFGSSSPVFAGNYIVYLKP